MTVDQSATQLWADSTEGWMYDRLSLTVIFVYGRVVQTRDLLSDSPFGSANQNKNICAAQQSSELLVTIMDYNQTFRRSFKLSEQKKFYIF